MSFSIAILISGRGSNMKALIDGALTGSYFVGKVLSNNPTAEGLHVARQQAIPTTVLDHRPHTTREHYDKALVETLEETHPDMICLAGFMRILTKAFFENLKKTMPRCRILNMHPSLLPKFRGANAQKQALEAYHRSNGEEKETGCTVHEVVEEIDSGRTLGQKSVTIKHDDTLERLSQRILSQEHNLYPEVVGSYQNSF